MNEDMIAKEIVYAGCKSAKFLKPGCLRVFPSFKMMESESPRVRRHEMSTVRNALGSPLNRLGALDGPKTQLELRVRELIALELFRN